MYVVGTSDVFTDEGLLGLYSRLLGVPCEGGDPWRRSGVWAVRRPLPLGVLCGHPGRRLQRMRFDQAVCWPRPGWLSGQGALVWVEPRAWDCPTYSGHGSV